MIRLLCVSIVALVLSACAASRTTVDPTLRWTAVTTDCVGAPISDITYNVYIVPGAGPVPTVTAGTGELPCGGLTIADRASIQPDNAAPLTGTSYHAALNDGVYTAAVEAVNAAGAVSALSNQKTFTVRGRPAAIIDLSAQ